MCVSDDGVPFDVSGGVQVPIHRQAADGAVEYPVGELGAVPGSFVGELTAQLAGGGIQDGPVEASFLSDLLPARFDGARAERVMPATCRSSTATVAQPVVGVVTLLGMRVSDGASRRGGAGCRPGLRPR